MDYRYTPKNHLHLFDAETETGGPIEGDEYRLAPDTRRFPDTTTPPDWEVFSPHGVGIGAQKDNIVTLYVVNHGGRESIGIFDLEP